MSPWSGRNDVLKAWSLSLVLWGLLVAAFGWAALPFLVLQGVLGFTLLEAVNYLEHYGLLRQRNEAGRYEKVDARHSWNSDRLATNLFLLQLQRHSDHHANPTRRYQVLRSLDVSPQLPMGYNAMIVLSLFPPLWRAMMDPKVAAHFGGDVSLAPTCRSPAPAVTKLIAQERLSTGAQMTDPASPIASAPMFSQDAATQLRWLVDRALISDLMVTFARALDERDWDTYANTYTEDGVFAIGDFMSLDGREKIKTMTASERGIGGYSGTWHGSSNHTITIDGDTATLHSYLIGVHMLSKETTDHADGAGWYDCELVRTSEGWRFTRVRISEVWHAGKSLRHVPPPH